VRFLESLGENDELTFSSLQQAYIFDNFTHS